MRYLPSETKKLRMFLHQVSWKTQTAVDDGAIGNDRFR
jgi:hypothetical protein